MTDVKRVLGRENYSICAIVVTFHPDHELLLQLLKTLQKQVDNIVVVDNGSGAATVRWLEDMADGGIVVVTEGRNRGVAAAHNKGIAWAGRNRATHILLVDQDSIPEDDMVDRLMEAAETLSTRGIRFAAVGPRYIEEYSAHKSAFIRFGWIKFRQIHCKNRNRSEIIRADFLISSGSLIPLDVVSDVGEMDERLFIDHVDTEWFLRARSQGYRAYGVCNAVMRHSLGDSGFRVWLGTWRYLPQHTPLRHYYIVRNSLLLYKRKYAPIKWVINDLVRLAVIFLLYTLVQPPRWQRVSMMARGVKHGIVGRVGKY